MSFHLDPSLLTGSSIQASSGGVRIKGDPNCVLVTNHNGEATWVPVEQFLSKFLNIDLQHPAVLDRLKNAQQALSNLEMTIKMVQK